jgi:hypothetical protein
MSVRHKSLHRSKNAKLWKKRANQRAAKERKRLERRALANPPAEISGCALLGRVWPQSGFRITVVCLEDGERVSFTTTPSVWGGLTVSPTLAGKKVAAVLRYYMPTGN